MGQVLKNNLKANEFLWLSFITVINLLFQFFALQALGNSAVYILLISNGIFLLFFLNYMLSMRFSIFLIMLNLVPLIYFNNLIHYTFYWVIIQDIPLFIVLLIALFNLIMSNNAISIKFTYLNKALYIFGLYFIFLAFLGYARGNNTTQIMDELYHAFYYLFAMILVYHFKKRTDYKIIFYIIIAISLIISTENIVINLFAGVTRFVTFQTDILIIPIGILFSYLLMYKNKSSILYFLIAILFSVIFVGVMITLTRSLWVSVLVAIIACLLFYLKQYKKVQIKKVLLYGIFLIIPALVFSSGTGKSVSSKSADSISYRTQTLTDPSKDQSFLMRVEIAYYAIQDFLKSPVWGRGLGASVQYKILYHSRANIYYPDNSFLFFLWKGGVLGLIIFIWLYVRFFKQAYKDFLNCTSNEGKVLLLGILGGMMGLVFSGLFGASLIKYKYDVIIAIIFAYIEFENQNIISSGDERA